MARAGILHKIQKEFQIRKHQTQQKSRARQTIYVCIFPYLFLNTPIVLVNCPVQERERGRFYRACGKCAFFVLFAPGMIQGNKKREKKKSLLAPRRPASVFPLEI